MDGSGKPVVVLGASGYVGGLLVPALAEAGIPVRAVGRSPQRLAHLARPGVEIWTADVLDRSSLRGALAGARAAYYLVHSMGEGGPARAFADWDRFGAQNFVLEARGLDQVVYLGGLGRPEDTLSPHLRSRLEVGDILLSGAAPATVLRAGIVVGDGSASFQMLVALARRLPVMVCPRWVQTRTQPIAIGDTLAYLVAALGKGETYNRSLEIGGPDVLTYREMLRRTAAILGKRPLIIQVPVLTPHLSSYWVDLVTPVPASIAHPLIEGLRNEVVVGDDTARRLLPIPLTPFDRAVRLALRIQGAGRQETTSPLAGNADGGDGVR